LIVATVLCESSFAEVGANPSIRGSEPDKCDDPAAAYMTFICGAGRAIRIEPLLTFSERSASLYEADLLKADLLRADLLRAEHPVSVEAVSIEAVSIEAATIKAPVQENFRAAAFRVLILRLVSVLKKVPASPRITKLFDVRGRRVCSETRFFSDISIGSTCEMRHLDDIFTFLINKWIVFF
jgi:hypothetical protein